MEIKNIKSDFVEYTTHGCENVVIDNEMSKSIEAFIKRQNEIEIEKLNDIMPF